MKKTSSSSSEFQSPNELYEKIGHKILESYESDSQSDDFKISPKKDPVKRIKKLMETPIDELPPDWDEELKKQTDKLSLADYAVYGKQITSFLLEVQKKTRKQMSTLHEEKIIHSAKSSPSSSSHSKKNIHKYRPKEREITHKSLQLKPRKFPTWLPTYDGSDDE